MTMFTGNAEVKAAEDCRTPKPCGSRGAFGVRQSSAALAGRHRPRLGFLGLGWIGRNRLEAVLKADCAEIVAIADPVERLCLEAARLAPGAAICDGLSSVQQLDIDGLIIATPSAFHAAQTIQALGNGWAVFCQKPLGRTAEETRKVISAARKCDRLLGVDLSYRFVKEVIAVRDLVRSGALGKVYAAELTFHNAYGPDKPWYYDPKLSGGGCVMDLGIHLVDLALWILDGTTVSHLTSRLYSQGVPFGNPSSQVEDFAIARLDLSNGATVQLGCSWKLPAGCDAIISGTFYGSKGGAAFRNVDGSFYRFVAERFRDTKRETIARDDTDWGGRAAIDWARRLATSSRFDPEIESLAGVGQTLDSIYEGGAR